MSHNLFRHPSAPASRSRMARAARPGGAARVSELGLPKRLRDGSSDSSGSHSPEKVDSHQAYAERGAGTRDAAGSSDAPITTAIGHMQILFANYEYPPIGGGGGVVMAALAAELTRRGDRKSTR